MTVRIRETDDWDEVGNALREIDKRLPAKLRKSLRDSTKPIVKKVKTRARMIPVLKKEPGTGLRRRVARGVGVRASLRTNSVRITTSTFNQDERAIPRGMDMFNGKHTGWRHPVPRYKGMRRKYRLWVRQMTGAPWFRQPISNSADEIRENLKDVVEAAANYIANRDRF